MIICIHPSQLPHSPVYEVPFIFYRRRLRYGRFIVGLNARIGNESKTYSAYWIRADSSFLQNEI